MSYKYRASAECEEWAAGKQRTFARWSRKVWEKFADYGRSRLPNPCRAAMEVAKEVALVDAEVFRELSIRDIKEIDSAKAEKRKPALVAGAWEGMEDRLWEKALLIANRYLSAGSPELRSLLTSTEGEGYLFFLLLSEKDPTINEDIAWEVYTDLKTNPCTEDETGQRADDGRRTVRNILEVVQGIAPESVKNADSPAE